MRKCLDIKRTHTQKIKQEIRNSLSNRIENDVSFFFSGKPLINKILRILFFGKALCCYDPVNTYKEYVLLRHWREMRGFVC